MQIELSIIIAVLGCVVGITGWIRNRDTDKGGNIRQMTTLEVKLDQVIAGLQDIKIAAKQTETCVQGLEARMHAAETQIITLATLVKKGE